MKNFLDEYAQYLPEQDLADLTTQIYLADAASFVEWFEGHTGDPFALEHVTPSDVRDYRAHLQDGLHLRASTVNRKLASLNSFLNWGVETGKLPANPAARIKYVSKSSTTPRWLDRRERYALQRALEKDLQIARMRYPKRWLTRRRDASLVEFMQNTGLRLGEIIQLELADTEMSDRKGRVLIRQGKGNKERVVPLNKQAREALNEWLKVRPQCASPHVWISVEMEQPGKLSARAVQRVLKRYGQEAGIPHLTPHTLRHTFAKTLADRHVGVEVIAQLLGHGNLNTTQIYIKPNYMDLQDALED